MMNLLYGRVRFANQYYWLRVELLVLVDGVDDVCGG